MTASQTKLAARGASRTRRRAGATEQRRNGRPPRAEGRGGARLASAFESVETFPVLAEARRRALKLAKWQASSTIEISKVVESDVGLTLVVLRTANARPGHRGIGSVPAAVEAIGPADLCRALEAATAYDFLDSGGHWGAVPESTRRHSVATRIAVERIGELARLPARDELATAAILHDFGRLVLISLYGEYGKLTSQPGIGAEERLRIERRELGIDHAIVGGVLARRIGLPAAVAAPIERHHAVDAQGADAAVGLADLIAHHAHGDPVPGELCRSRAKALELEPSQLRALLYEYPYAATERSHASEPCPLSERELDVLRRLAAGKVYRRIADEMGLSPSTVRTHLHNVYRKIGAADRAQAVITATERGWI